MKLKGAKAVHYEAGPDMTPLVDVVMVLLIFLMMVGKFGGQDRYFVSKMGISVEGAGTTPPKEIEGEINVSIFGHADNVSIIVDPDPAGKATLRGDTKNVNAYFKKRAETNPDLKTNRVFLSPSKDIRYQNVIAIYAAINDAGFEKIGFKTAK